jgi:3'(2'), 5'-bisphosphate nucleotidase
LQGLSRLLPGVPVVSEEAAAKSAQLKARSGSFVLVDPLDVTRELLAGRDEFTINVAIVDYGAPLARHRRRTGLGRVVARRRGQRCRAAGAGGGCTCACCHRPHPIHTRECPRSGLIAVVSRSHLDSRTVALLASYSSPSG